MLDTRLADRIRAKGVAVEEVAGWQTRGRPAAYQPRGAVNHHTAGARSGLTPSLATVLYGRSDVPGPLAQVLQSREADPSTDKAYVVAAGAANHAGAGGWNGLTGNTSVGGLEVEHHGTGPVPQERLEISARIIAALLEAPGSTRNAAYACQHFEWTTRKIDFYDLAPWSKDSFRQRVGYWIGRTTSSSPSPAPKDWFDMATEAQLRKIVREEAPTLDEIALKVIQTLHPDHDGHPVRVGDLNPNTQTQVRLLVEATVEPVVERVLAKHGVIEPDDG